MIGSVKPEVGARGDDSFYTSTLVVGCSPVLHQSAAFLAGPNLQDTGFPSALWGQVEGGSGNGDDQLLCGLPPSGGTNRWALGVVTALATHTVSVRGAEPSKAHCQ